MKYLLLPKVSIFKSVIYTPPSRGWKKKKVKSFSTRKRVSTSKIRKNPIIISWRKFKSFVCNYISRGEGGEANPVFIRQIRSFLVLKRVTKTKKLLSDISSRYGYSLSTLHHEEDSRLIVVQPLVGVTGPTLTEVIDFYCLFQRFLTRRDVVCKHVKDVRVITNHRYSDGSSAYCLEIRIKSSLF